MSMSKEHKISLQNEKGQAKNTVLSMGEYLKKKI